MKNITSAVFIAALFLNSCSTTQPTISDKMEIQIPAELAQNPFMRKSPLQYQTPEFDKIKNEHFKPAFDYGLKVHSAEIDAIANNPAKPTLENTLVALEKSGEILKRARTAFSTYAGAHTNPTIQQLAKEYAGIFAAHSDKLYLNDKIYQRIKAIDPQNLDAESKRLREDYLQSFEIAGAALSPDKKEELKKINQELASLQTEFGSKLLDANKKGGILIEDVKELDGLSPDQIAATAADAKAAGHEGKYWIALQNTTQQPLLQNLKNRATREKLFKASWNRAEKGDANDTRSTIEKTAELRLKKAQLLGKESFAAWKLQDQMAQNPDAALALMKQLAKPAVETAKKEEAEIQKLIDAQKGGFKVQPWDWNFYAEQVRKEKFDLDENEIKPYFEVTTVLEKGVFFAAEKFFGLTFKKRTDIPVYHPDVVTYEVFDHDGTSLALYHLDFYARDTKRGGAWMSNFVSQSHLQGTKPVITNVYNYQKPAPGKPSLISFDDVETLFHEFGHSIHGIFANQQYASLSGTAVPRDFVEFPSQINEHFALEPEVIKNYALHYETKQPIPDALIEKIKKADTFNQGYMTTELVSAAMADMTWHTVKDKSQFKPVLEFEKEALENNGFTLASVPPRYHAPYFSHVWGGGYSAGYYAYIWAETLDADAWEWIKSNGGMTRENGDRYRKYILSVGNSEDLNEAYRKFSGRNPGIEPLLRMRGFTK